ncbi:MAG TPA: hypothetical protein VFA11_13015 [Acidimicrobiales bacterium]|nr:hypothetical protein [Acidimicrobiales bacterium]
MTRRRLVGGIAVLVAGTWWSACGGPPPPRPPAPIAGPLRGVLRIQAGSCDRYGNVSGSWFRMLQPGGTLASGPYVVNADSSCANKTWTPVAPGTQGLRLGRYQPAPLPAFDGAANGLGGAIIQPVLWFGVGLAAFTSPRDPRTGISTPPPALSVRGTALAGQLQAFSVSWNGEELNQGAPKPGPVRPGPASAPVGTFDQRNHRFVLDWSSRIVGGPFNNFTGVWHLTGTYRAQP